MKNEVLYRQLEQALAAFPEKVDAFEPEELDVVPFEGSWTPGQVAEHMILANSGFIELVNGPVSETGRELDEKVPDIRETLLDFSTKLTSPEFVLPVKQVHEKDQLLSALMEIKAGILDAVESLDHDKTCTGFSLPVLGHLTRLEAFSFVLYHTQRHTHQLENIRRALAEEKL